MAISESLPKNIFVGNMQTSHVQGICIDTARKYIYFSFTTVLVKALLDGTVVGSCGGLTGHLGDIDFNDDDGRVYGSLEYKKAPAFYIAIFNVDKIDRIGMDAESDGIMTAVYLGDVVRDFTADMDENGIFDGDVALSGDHRYGCSGIDGTSFGPAFGEEPDSPPQLMIAYGIYGNTSRDDNDYQIITQYDWRRFSQYERPLNQLTPHKSGFDEPDKKYFLYTGNTVFGIQNLEYDYYTKNWLIAVYNGKKEQYPNYPMYIADGTKKPYEADVMGQTHCENALMLTLAGGGIAHNESGISGYTFPLGQTGLIALDDGYYYISKNGSNSDGQYSDVRLYRWTGNSPEPFEMA